MKFKLENKSLGREKILPTDFLLITIFKFTKVYLVENFMLITKVFKKLSNKLKYKKISLMPLSLKKQKKNQPKY